VRCRLPSLVRPPRCLTTPPPCPQRSLSELRSAGQRAGEEAEAALDEKDGEIMTLKDVIQTQDKELEGE
jgi:hypothetical protein